MATVDSSVGGKTGVNHPLGKNMIGAFYQPQCVLIDTDTLNTLPDRELASGISEIIKYGLIRDAPLFEWLEQNMDRLLQRDAEVSMLLQRSVSVLIDCYYCRLIYCNTLCLYSSTATTASAAWLAAAELTACCITLKIVPAQNLAAYLPANTCIHPFACRCFFAALMMTMLCSSLPFLLHGVLDCCLMVCALPLQAWTYAIQQSCLNKAAVVAADEREGGVRATLNLGHTFGHAIETGQGYGKTCHYHMRSFQQDTADWSSCC